MSFFSARISSRDDFTLSHYVSIVSSSPGQFPWLSLFFISLFFESYLSGILYNIFEFGLSDVSLWLDQGYGFGGRTWQRWSTLLVASGVPKHDFSLVVLTLGTRRRWCSPLWNRSFPVPCAVLQLWITKSSGYSRGQGLSSLPREEASTFIIWNSVMKICRTGILNFIFAMTLLVAKWSLWPSS